MYEPHEIVRDSFGRWRVEFDENLAIGVRLLAEDNPRRIETNTQAYIVMDIRTKLGMMRIRDIRVMQSNSSDRYFIRYRQWNTGRARPGTDQEEWLDVAAPLDGESRASIQEACLGVFLQIKKEAKEGVLGGGNRSRRLPRTRDSLPPPEPSRSADEVVATVGPPPKPGKRRPNTLGPLGSNPVLAAQLESLRATLASRKPGENHFLATKEEEVEAPAPSN